MHIKKDSICCSDISVLKSSTFKTLSHFLSIKSHIKLIEKIFNTLRWWMICSICFSWYLLPFKKWWITMNKLKNMKLFLYIFTFEEEDSKDLKIKKRIKKTIWGFLILYIRNWSMMESRWVQKGLFITCFWFKREFRIQERITNSPFLVHSVSVDRVLVQ